MTGGARREFVNRLLSQPALCLAEVYRKRGDVYDHTGVYDRAKADYGLARDLFSSMRCRKECGEIDHAVGNLLLNMGAFEQAENVLKQALKAFVESQDDANIAKCYKELGKVCQYQENPDAALSYYQQAKSIFESFNDVKGCYIVLEYAADVLRAKGRYNDALEIIEELQDFYQRENILWGLSRINKLAGNVFMEKGEIEKSLCCLDRAYHYSMQIGERSMAMYVLCDLGLACFNLEKYETAYNHFIQCLHMAEKMDSIYMKVVNLVNIADTKLMMGDIERSKVYIDRAAIINHNIGGLNSEIKRIQEEIAKKEGGREKAGQEKSIETQGKKGPHAP